MNVLSKQLAIEVSVLEESDIKRNLDCDEGRQTPSLVGLLDER